MKNKFQYKVVVFFALVSLLAPLFSNAAIIVPTINLVTIVNTQGQDASFHFDLKSCSGVFCNDIQQFDLQTHNLSGSNLTSFFPSGDKYVLTQNYVSGLKIDSINCTSNDSRVTFTYQQNSVSFSSVAWSSVTCTFNNVKIQEKNPVLIVPGIMGTELKKGDELLWADVGRMLVTPGDSFMDPLAFSGDLKPSDADVAITDVIKSKTATDYTEGLINEFLGQGYKENETLFLFPYDWRYGISGKFSDGKTNVDLLKQKIADIMQQTGSDKVDVVAHSMGGLIVKKYVMDNLASNHINKAIFVAVPSTGSPKSVKVLIQGDDMDVAFLGLGLSASEVKKISQNMPGVYDLLPTKKYSDIKGSFVSLVNYESGEPMEKDLNYDEFKSYLNDKGMNSSAMLGAEALHSQTYDDFDLRTAGINLYAIDGCKMPTMTNFVEFNSKDILGNNHTDYARVEWKVGDNTVPIESSTNLPIDQSNKFYALQVKHSDLLSFNGSRQQIVNLISNSSLPVGGNLITQDISKCELNGKGISVFSPVDIFVTDQFGNKLGLADDGSIINEIHGADFEIWGERKFIYLPTDEGQVYTTNLQGTSTGTYTIKVDDIQNTQTTQTEVFSNLPVTESLTGTVNISQDNTTTITITPAEGEQPITITPSATIGAEASEDILPPISAATIAGSQGQPNFYNSDVSINITAQDNNSGILDIEYNLDNMGSQKVQSATSSIPVATEGNHTITFFATDKAGNNEQPKTINFTIDKTAPEVEIQFDPALKDLKFVPQDVTQTTIQDQDDIITITDQAGNTTEINLKDKNRKVAMKAEIKSIKYNGVASDISKNAMAFLWLSDKSKSLKLLSQYAKSTKDYSILAVYDGKNTTLVGKDQTGKIFKTEKGLKLIKITTNKGALSWGW